MQEKNVMSVEDIEALEDAYEDYSTKECKCAIRTLRAKLENLQQTGNTPFNFYYRIKSYASTIDKCGRRGYPIDIMTIKKKIRDVAAMRVVVIFRDDIYQLVEDIRRFPGVSIIDEDDYIKGQKDNGYSSYHLTVLVENMIGSELRKTPVEIQIRDNYMESWAQSEHEIFYKKDLDDPEAQQELKEVADILTEAAKRMMRLRDRIRKKMKEDSDPKTSTK